MARLDDKNSSTDPSSSGSLDAQAEKLLRDIEGTSPFVLRTSYAPEDLDPSDVAAPGVEHEGEEPADGFEEEAHMEVPAVHVVREVEQVVADQQAQVAAEESARLKRHRLRNTLILVVVILVAIAAVIGVFILRNSISPAVDPSDTESLIASGSSSETQFQPVDSGLVPQFSKLFGKSMTTVRERTQGRLSLKGDRTPASDDVVKDLAYLQDASLLNSSGVRFADVTLGLDKHKKLVYVYVRYDLDVLGVADADFQTIVSDGTVVQSLLVGMGVDAESVPLSAVQLSADLQAAAAQTLTDDDDVQEYTFTGQTGAKKAPTMWEATVSYDRSAGRVKNDNSVIRSIGVELR